ncbi:shTK domain protein, partial [Ostertagia ostertagi]
MYRFLLSSSLLVGCVWAGAVDLNCTIYEGGALKMILCGCASISTLFSSLHRQQIVKINCRPANCAALYGAAAVAGQPVNRDVKCGGDTAIDPQLVQAAVDLCPKHCGYCCLTPAFLCHDKLQPRIPCSSVTQAMCESIAWKNILQEDCPKTCGFCDTGNCVDTAPGCNLDGGIICQSRDSGTFARQYCKKTCGYCQDATVAPGWSFVRLHISIF